MQIKGQRLNLIDLYRDYFSQHQERQRFLMEASWGGDDEYGMEYGAKEAKIHLEHQQIGPDALQALLAALIHFPEITALSLSGNPIGNKGASLLKSFLLKTGRICEVSLGQNNIGQRGLLELIYALPYLPKLKDLYLGDNVLATCSLSLLTYNLSRTNLEHLEIESANGWGRMLAMSFLAKALPNCASLKFFAFRRSDLGDDGACLFANILPQCPQLESLDLSHNNIGEKGLKHLFDVLPKTNLTRIDAANQISWLLLDPVGKQFLEVCKKNKAIMLHRRQGAVVSQLFSQKTPFACYNRNEFADFFQTVSDTIMHHIAGNDASLSNALHFGYKKHKEMKVDQSLQRGQEEPPRKKRRVA